jgi:hypothetical protein
MHPPYTVKVGKMAHENQIPVDVPEELYTWIAKESERKGVAVEDLVSNALRHYRLAVVKVNPDPGFPRAAGF